MNSAKYFADMQRQRAAEAAMLAKIEKDRQQDATVGFSFKDMLQKMVRVAGYMVVYVHAHECLSMVVVCLQAAEHDLLFQPKNRTEKGNVVYSFGKAAIFLDRYVVPWPNLAVWRMPCTGTAIRASSTCDLFGFTGTWRLCSMATNGCPYRLKLCWTRRCKGTLRLLLLC